jgi:hypothetical protein
MTVTALPELRQSQARNRAAAERAAAAFLTDLGRRRQP